MVKQALRQEHRRGNRATAGPTLAPNYVLRAPYRGIQVSACAGPLVDMSLIRPVYPIPVCQKSHSSECQELQQDNWKTKDGIDVSYSFRVHSLPSFDQCVGDAEGVPWNRSGSVQC